MIRFLVYSDLHYELGGRFIPPAQLRGTVDEVTLACDIASGGYAIHYARQIAEQVEVLAILIGENH